MLETIQGTLIADIYEMKRALAPYIDGKIPNIEARIDIFVNNRIFGHLDLLCSIYSVTNQILGADFFEAIAREFIAISVQPSGNRHEYGKDFATYLANCPRLEALRYVGDVAAIEWAHFCAILAEDALATDLNEIQEWLEIGAAFGVKLHPSAQIIECQWNALEIWQAHQNLPFDDIDLRADNSKLLCWRDQNCEILFLSITDLAAALIAHSDFENDFATALADVVGSTVDQVEASNFQSVFAQMVDAGALTIKERN